MSGHDSDEVANPHRTQVEQDDPLSLGQPTPDGEDEEQEGERRDQHDQPWPEVAEEVKKAVEEAAGPLD